MGIGSSRQTLLWIYRYKCWTFKLDNSTQQTSYLSLFDWWAYQESDAVWVPWLCSGCLFEYSRCILAMMMLHQVHGFLHALSTRLSFWKNLNAHWPGRSLEHWTIDQLLCWIGRCSCSKSPFAINVTHFATSSLELIDVSFFYFLSEWRYLFPQSDDNCELRLCTHPTTIRYRRSLDSTVRETKVARIDRFIALSWFDGWWCMAVLSWWSHMSGGFDWRPRPQHAVFYWRTLCV